MKRIIGIFFLLILFTGCTSTNTVKEVSLLNVQGSTITERFEVPESFTRLEVKEGSFGEYLRNLTLKPHGSKVYYYNGEPKPHNIYEAVIDMDIGKKNLQQCADAVIRLRAEYLYKHKKYGEIHINFTNGFKADFGKWIKGYRIIVKRNDVSWKKLYEPSSDYKVFRQYLEKVFIYAGTLSLAKELKHVDLTDMRIGDVFIQGGSPGHCVIVVDMAINDKTGEKLFMLAQSYMPAQDIHILKNQNNNIISPWYSLQDIKDDLVTPQWTFKDNDLKRF